MTAVTHDEGRVLSDGDGHDKGRWIRLWAGVKQTMRLTQQRVASYVRYGWLEVEMVSVV